MNEIKIELTEVNPQEFFGSQNRFLEKIRSYYPKLKIVARGSTLKAYGEPELIEDFESKSNMLLMHFAKYNALSDEVIERILQFNPNEPFLPEDASEAQILHGVGGKIIRAKTINQKRLIESVNQNDMVFAIGPAGTGKTYTGVALAVKALKEKRVSRIILTRPAVEAGENLGFLPGDLKDKLDPYMQPLYDALKDMIQVEKLDDYIKRGIIEIAPLAYMRGRTLDNAFVILDESGVCISSIKTILFSESRPNSYLVSTNIRPAFSAISVPLLKSSSEIKCNFSYIFLSNILFEIISLGLMS